jgi:hypothetical protein
VAKLLRSLRLCRLRSARQDKVSVDPRIKCSCDTVGWRGDLVKVASPRRLGLGRAEGVSVAWGGPRARRESSRVGCLCPRLGSGEARSCPLCGLSLDLNHAHQAFAALCWWGLPVEIRSLGGTPNYGPRQIVNRLNQSSEKLADSSLNHPGIWGCMSHPVLEGKLNANHVRDWIRNSRTHRLHNWTSSHNAQSK